jgi:hypothetical protein
MLSTESISMRLRAIWFFVLLAAAGYVQAATVSEEDALQVFASRPTAQTGRSQEIDRIVADGAHAVISAVELDDSTARPSSMRGVRMDLSDANGEAHVYISEERLLANIQALEEISSSSPRFLARHPTGDHMSCFGSGYFWMRPAGAFTLSECQTANGRFLAVRGGRDFRFNGLDPQTFANALVGASAELARR